jgi:hypothetical protein
VSFGSSFSQLQGKLRLDVGVRVYVLLRPNSKLETRPLLLSVRRDFNRRIVQ